MGMPFDDKVLLFRKYLPIVSEQIYLANAAVSPLPSTVKRVIIDHLEIHCNLGISGVKATKLPKINMARVHAAQIFHCHPGEIAMIPNTTSGINLIANGLHWHKGENVIIPDNEFPANVYPWLALQVDGVEIRRVPTRRGVFGPGDIEKLIDSKTRLISVSHVGYASGFRADLGGIADVAHKHGVHFVVDAAQSAGALDIDVKALNIDALACSGWKWLMGPIGTGLLYCSNDFCEKVHPLFAGAGSMIFEEYDPPVFPFVYNKGAARFECSSLNILAISGISEAAKNIHQMGLKDVEKRVLENIALLYDGLGALGFEFYFDGDVRTEARCGIISVKHPKVATKELKEYLADNNVESSAWYGYLRFSPHFYNTTAELEQVLALLKEYLKSKNMI